MFTNVFRAKISTHALLVAIGVLAFMAHQFFSDPNAAAWISRHWIAKDLYETIGATLIAFGVYRNPTPPTH
jgi:hypothetical protein